MTVRHAARDRQAAPEPPARTSRIGLEVALVALACIGVTLAANRSLLGALSTTAPGNLGDPLYFAWQMSWVGHALGTDPGSLWTTNAFLRAPDSLAFTDAVLGYAPLTWLGEGQAGALQALNLAVLLATALACGGGYALARVLGAGIAGSLVAGAGFGFAPWRLEQVIHINVLSTGGMALTLACLAHGHGWSLRSGWRPERIRPRWIAAGWAVACWQLTLGFAVGIPFVYVLAACLAAWAAGWLLVGRPPLPRGLLVAHGIGGLSFALLGWLLTRPYLRVVEANPVARRTPEMLDLFSPPWRGLLTAPETSTSWGERQRPWRSELFWPPEMVLSPGMVLLGLAVLGLVVSVWPVRRRLVLAAAIAGMTVLALGTQAPGKGRWSYVLLWEHAPGWEALRTPGRLIIWVTLGLCLLAAGAVARLSQLLLQRTRTASRSWPSRATRTARAVAVLVLLVPAAAVLYEGRGNVPHWPVSTSPVDVRSLRAPVLFLPSDVIGDYHMMLWSTEGWPTLANGSSGFDPPAQAQLREVAATFPDVESVAEMRRRGIATVVLVRSRAAGGPWEGAADLPVEGLGIGRRDLADAVVYDLGAG